jgi:hypothetical protein
MKEDFEFRGQRYSLEMTGQGEAEGGFYNLSAQFFANAQPRQGIFRLTKLALETAKARAERSRQAEVEVLLAGCRQALEAELYIRAIGPEFKYVVDHRFFEEQ